MSTTTCEQCRSAPGTQHTFHYGRSAPVVDRPQAMAYHASAYPRSMSRGGPFELGGVEAVSLCDHCLARARARRAGSLLRRWVGMPLIASGYAVLLVGVLAWAFTSNWAQAAIWLGVGLVATAVAYSVAYVMLENEDFAQHTAVDVHLEKLRAQGWDSFWTDKEFSSLTPH
jgi:hypothetical protein